MSSLYQQVSRSGLTFHLTEHHGGYCPGAAVFVWMSGFDEFHQELVSKNYPRLRPSIETMFYGARCVEVIDPFGNRLKFNERVEGGVSQL